MTNDELLAELEIIKMLSEESRPEIELFKVPYLLFLLIIWYCRAGTWCQLKFSTLSESWFGSPTIFVGERMFEIIFCKFHRHSRFIYLISMINEWSYIWKRRVKGEHEIVSFSELYNVNIHVLMQWLVQLLSQSWKWSPHSYNIFTVDEQQSFWFVINKIGSV